MAVLIIASGNMQGRNLVLPDKEIIIGRDEDCHLRLNSSLVSRQHCELRPSEDGIWVRDLSSQNGTYVNEVPITEPYLLKPRDILRVGAQLFQVPDTERKSEPRPAATKPKVAAESGSAILKKKPAKSDKISDADIADWLSDQGPPDGVDRDTTVIEDTNSNQPTTNVPAGTPAKAPVAAKAKPRTVKEEAADIIKKHWETVRAKESKP